MIGNYCPHQADECARIHLLTIILNKNTIFPDDRVGSVNYDNEGWIPVGTRATYMVESVHVDEAINRRLEALGVNENTPLLVMNKKNSGTMIIKVRGTRLALGKRITGGIEVKEEAAS